MTISTPCIQRCGLNDATGLCLGCGRTLAEIMDWAAMSETERLTVMTALPARLSGVPADLELMPMPPPR